MNNSAIWYCELFYDRFDSIALNHLSESLHGYDNPQSSLDKGDSARSNSDILVHQENQDRRDDQASCTERPAEQPELRGDVQDQPTNGTKAMSELDPSILRDSMSWKVLIVAAKLSAFLSLSVTSSWTNT